MADVFGVDVQTLEVKESAALGAALRAAHSWLHDHDTPVGWNELRGAVVKTGAGGIVKPSADASRRYHAPNGLLAVYAACEKFIFGLGPDPEEKIQAFRAAFPE
jgi:glycerol kinase